MECLRGYRALAVCSLMVGLVACGPRVVGVYPGDAGDDAPPPDDVVVVDAAPADTASPDVPPQPDAPPPRDVPPPPDAPDFDAPQPDDVPKMLDVPPPPDAPPPPPDVPIVTDTPVVPDAAPGCRSDRECSASMQVCDAASGRCVDCNRDVDCLTPCLVCVSNRCVTPPTRCVSSRMCPGQVCDATRGVCVDCVADVDCPAGQTCRSNLCSRAACTPGAATCAGASRSVCNPDGLASTATPCPAGAHGAGARAGGACALACAAGFFNCDGSAANGCESAVACPSPILGELGGPSGYGPAENCLGPNDDVTFMGAGADGGAPAGAIDIRAAFPTGLQYFGATYNAMYMNNNGDVSFRAALGTFTPMPFPVADQPMIAPWWGDVDTRGGGQPMRNNVCFVVQPHRVIVTWHRVGYFSTHDDLSNTFQLVLADRSDVRAGDFDVEFRYQQCQWTTGDASGGTGGFGGTPAQVGFDAGNRRDFVSLPMSRTMGILDVCRTSNVPGGVAGLWRFTVRGGVVSM